MKKDKAIIHIITGDGKGKTTAALGLALRAVGAGKRVAIIQFMKKGDSSEIKTIKKYKLPIDVECFGIGYYQILGDKHTAAQHKKAAQKALAAAKKAIKSEKYDLIILDEINAAVGFGLLDVDDVIEMIKPKSHPGSVIKSVDIVLTGRRAPAKLKKIAQLVSDVRKVKHYFDDGFKARKGIEF